MHTRARVEKHVIFPGHYEGRAGRATPARYRWSPFSIQRALQGGLSLSPSFLFLVLRYVTSHTSEPKIQKKEKRDTKEEQSRRLIYDHYAYVWM
jgi:hypothetical protein